MIRKQRLLGLAGALLIFMLLGTVTPVMAQAQSIVEKLEHLAEMSQAGLDAAQRNDVVAMQNEYEAIHEAWALFEDDVRGANPTLYVELEAALADVKNAVMGKQVDDAAAGVAFDRLFDQLNLAQDRLVGGETNAVIESATIPSVLDKLNASLTALRQGDTKEGAELLQFVTQAWPSIEDTVAAKSQSDYNAIESELGKALSALNTTPADIVSAEASVGRVHATLAPYATQQTYSAFDAAAVILREGLEALLVVVALLAVLQRSGNKNKQGWVWMGVGIGVLVSIATGFVLQIVFSRVTAGQNRELIEGITGLVAAGLLLYVSYWLHSKSSIAAWQNYIHAQTSQALARGSMFGLAALAFLTVFREGAETTIFYMGMAPSISTNDLLLGLALGMVILSVVAVLMLVLGIRLPLRLFFQVAGILVYYLGFKFLGRGVHALQVAGAASGTPIAFVPEVPFLGLYPTWETLIPQIVLIVAAVIVVWMVRDHEQKSPALPTTPRPVA